MALKWAAFSAIISMDPGIVRASQYVCATGENTSCAPCHSSVGTRMSAGSKPQSWVNERASSTQPAPDRLRASL